jgi:hypothetical protein
MTARIPNFASRRIESLSRHENLRPIGIDLPGDATDACAPRFRRSKTEKICPNKRDSKIYPNEPERSFGINNTAHSESDSAGFNHLPTHPPPGSNFGNRGIQLTPVNL